MITRPMFGIVCLALTFRSHILDDAVYAVQRACCGQSVASQTSRAKRKDSELRSLAVPRADER